MEQHTVTAPLGFSDAIPDRAALLAGVPPEPAEANRYVDLFGDSEGAFDAAGGSSSGADEPSGDRAPMERGPEAAPETRPIPALPRAPAPRFGLQVALLAAVAAAVGGVAIAAARPPRPVPPAGAAIPPDRTADASPAPGTIAPAAPALAVPAARRSAARIRRVAAPVEIDPRPAADDAAPLPVAAPVLVPGPDGGQSMSEPPLTGT